MNLQKKTLQRYRQFFPVETLRETSERTGIQITRVFRLFSGKNMKVAELEALEKAVTDRLAESPNFSHLTFVLEQASAVLTNDELGRITDYINRKLKAKTFGRMYISTQYQDAYIA